MKFARHTCALAVALVITSSAFAQGSRPPSGGPPTTSEPPQTVVDSTGKLVGEVIMTTNAFSGVSVKYPLPTGDSVIMSVNADRISTFGQRIREGESPETARAFFTTSDCSGDVYLFDFPSSQLTKRQILTLDQLRGGTGTPPDSSCVPMWRADQWLFATDELACWNFIPEGTTITFLSYYGFDEQNPNWETMCAPVPAGYSMPNPLHHGPNDAYKIYRPVEDLSTKFQPPFYIP